MKNWKKFISLAVVAALAVGLVGCGQDKKDQVNGGKEKVKLTVFAAASMTETLNKIKADYEKEHSERCRCGYFYFGGAKTDESA